MYRISCLLDQLFTRLAVYQDSQAGLFFRVQLYRPPYFQYQKRVILLRTRKVGLFWQRIGGTSNVVRPTRIYCDLYIVGPLPCRIRETYTGISLARHCLDSDVLGGILGC